MEAEKFARRRKQGEETKKRLMETATALFREKGFHNVTVDEIIEKADSSKGGFYNHFSTKEELLFRMTDLLDESYRSYLGQLSGRENPIDKITGFSEYIFTKLSAEIGLEFLSIIYSAQIRDPAFPNFSITPQRTYYQALEGFIEEGKSAGEIRENVPTDLIIRMITTGIRGVIYDWCLSRGGFDPAAYGRETIETLMQGLRSAGKAQP
jgi:TetR/AcrR family transcriptional regulator, fatty acid metabolism regulator protein